MFVLASKVRTPLRIWAKLEVGQLRNSDPKGLLDAFQPALTGVIRRKSDLLEEVTTIRVVMSPDRSIRLTYQLRHDVQVAYGFKKLGQLSEVLVRCYLLQVGLRQALPVARILIVWSLENNIPLLHDAFSTNRGLLPALLLREAELVLPCARLRVASDPNSNTDIRILSGGEASKARDAAAISDG